MPDRQLELPWEPTDAREFAPLPMTTPVLSPTPEVAPEVVTEVAPREPPTPDPGPAEVRDPQPDPSNRPPAYPGIARRRGWEGVVLLHVHVGVDGRALLVEIRQSSGRRILDRAAIDAVKAWRFRPATRDGIPLAGQTDVSIRFRLDD